MTFKCQHCGGDTRIMVSMTVSAPAWMAHQFSKKNIAKKEFEIWGVNWDAADFICQNPKCRRVFDGLGTWIDKLEKENKKLKAKLAGYEQETPLGGRPDKTPPTAAAKTSLKVRLTAVVPLVSARKD